MKIAITGGIGSGKTTARNLIAQMGYTVFDADTEARGLSTDATYVQQVLTAFPQAATPSGEIDRKALAAIVFQDQAALNLLNSLSHPAVMQRISLQMQAAEDRGERLVFAEIPLLFEGGYESLFDGVFVILRQEKERIAATCNRDGISKGEVAARIKNQIDYSKKDFSAYTIIENDGDLSTLSRRLAEEIEKIQ